MKKEEAYKWAGRQVRSKVKNHINTISTLANTAAILKERFSHYFWVGFYFFNEDHLLLGPFQGPPACVKLNLEKGVCAACANTLKPIIVDNVEEFPCHVACNSGSKSEIVIPIFDDNGKLRAILDVDSETLNDFDEIDEKGLSVIADLLTAIWE